MHFHHDFAYNTECYAKQILHIAETDITLSVPKLYLGTPPGPTCCSVCRRGKTVLYRDRWTPERLFELIERHHATVLTGVPTAMSRMLEADPQHRSLGSLRVVLSAVKPRRRALSPLPWAPMGSRFSTELAPPSCSTSTSAIARSRCAPARWDGWYRVQRSRRTRRWQRVGPRCRGG